MPENRPPKSETTFDMPGNYSEKPVLVIDAGIPFVPEKKLKKEFDVRRKVSHEVTPEYVKKNNVIAVIGRTKIEVTKELVGGTVEYIVSATAGKNHIAEDLPGSVTAEHCPGCNAESVAQHVASIFAHLEKNGENLSGKNLFVIGAGETGSRVARDGSQAFDMKVTLHDPPKFHQFHSCVPTTGIHELKAKKTSAENFPISREDFENDLGKADVVSLHVPLTESGEHATRHILDEATLSLLKSDVVIIHAARGGVIDDAALLGFLEKNPDARAYIDTWEFEQKDNWNTSELHEVNEALLKLPNVVQATSHTAGYSIGGKSRGTRESLQKMLQYFRVDLGFIQEIDQAVLEQLPKPSPIHDFSAENFDQNSFNDLILACYDIADDTMLLGSLEYDFFKLRNNYHEIRENNKLPIRHDFSYYTVKLDKDQGDIMKWKRKLEALQFKVVLVEKSAEFSD